MSTETILFLDRALVALFSGYTLLTFSLKMLFVFMPYLLPGVPVAAPAGPYQRRNMEEIEEDKVMVVEVKERKKSGHEEHVNSAEIAE